MVALERIMRTPTRCSRHREPALAGFPAQQGDISRLQFLNVDFTSDPLVYPSERNSGSLSISIQNAFARSRARSTARAYDLTVIAENLRHFEPSSAAVDLPVFSGLEK
jgi:hypothetical protein